MEKGKKKKKVLFLLNQGRCDCSSFLTDVWMRKKDGLNKLDGQRKKRDSLGQDVCVCWMELQSSLSFVCVWMRTNAWLHCIRRTFKLFSCHWVEWMMKGQDDEERKGKKVREVCENRLNHEQWMMWSAGISFFFEWRLKSKSRWMNLRKYFQFFSFFFW